MLKFFIIGEIIGLTGALIGLGFEKEWGLWITIVGALIALPSIFEPKLEKEKGDFHEDC